MILAGSLDLHLDSRVKFWKRSYYIFFRGEGGGSTVPSILLLSLKFWGVSGPTGACWSSSSYIPDALYQRRPRWKVIHVSIDTEY